MFSFELNDHPLLLGLPEEVDQGSLEDTALAIAEEVLEGQGQCAVSPREVADTIVNVLLERMPDDVIDPAERDDISGHSLRLVQPVPREVVLEALAANRARIFVHPRIEVEIYRSGGFMALNVPHERMDAIAQDGVRSAVVSDERYAVTRHRWGKQAFVMAVGIGDDGAEVIFHLPGEVEGACT
jgi:hypothetical protein